MKYLRSIKEKATEAEIIFLSRVSDTLVEQIQDEYRLGDFDNNRWVELFRNLEQNVSEYERLNISGEKINSVDKLKNYLEVSRHGYLKEQIIAKNSNLLAPIDGFM